MEPVVRVLVVVCRSGGVPGRPWVRCCSDSCWSFVPAVPHATPSTRQKFAHTDRHPIDTEKSLRWGRGSRGDQDGARRVGPGGSRAGV